MFERWATRRKRAELALHESTERYRALFVDNPHATFSLTPAGRFDDANAVTEESIGIDLARLRDMRFDEVIESADLPGAVEAFQAALAGEPQKVHTRIRDASGALRVLNVALVPVVVDDVLVGVHGIAEDMTEEDAVLRALQEARERAEAADAAKSHFLTNISHEVRTPLTSLLAAAEMLGEGVLDDEQQHLVALLRRSGERLLVLFDDVLDVSRLDRDEVCLERRTLRLQEVVDDLLGWARPLADLRGIGLRHEVAPGAPTTLVGDPGRLGQVLGNLVGNAIKFTDSGLVTVRVSGAREAERELVVLEVEDTGTGFPEARLDSLFEPFYQLDGSQTRRHGGAGLGLSICRDLVRLMGGRLTASSTMGVGSRFTVTLPTT